MSNRFSCEFKETGYFVANWGLTQPYLSTRYVRLGAHYFFYCAQPNATSASIQDVKTNLREYYVKHVKIDYRIIYESYVAFYMMVFVLNVPQDYTPSKTGATLNLSELPNHTMPENVLYYDLVKSRPTIGFNGKIFDINIDIKKHFKVSPSYKLAFVYYTFLYDGSVRSFGEGTAQVFFDVN